MYHTKLRKLFMFPVLLLSLSFGVIVHAEEIPEENYTLTNSRFETCVSMKPVEMTKYTIINEDGKIMNFEATKKDEKQAAELYKKIKRLKGRQKMHVSSKKYRNLSRIMAIIETKYFKNDMMRYQSEDDGDVTVLTFKGADVQKSIKERGKGRGRLALAYRNAAINAGITTQTTEHDAVVLINNYVDDWLYYNIEAYYHPQGLYGVFESGYGVCADYAGMFCGIATECGLKCGIVYDWEMNHAYNAVYVGGKVVYVDTCWNDEYKYDDGSVHPRQNNYIFMTEDEIRKSHGISLIKWNDGTVDSVARAKYN